MITRHNPEHHDDLPGSGEARPPSMSPFKRLNSGMLVGLACALLLVYHIWEWWFSQDIGVRDKMFATIIFLSTVGVMFWFSGDNASRDKAYIDTVHAEHLDLAARQIAIRIQFDEFKEEIQLARNAERAELEHIIEKLNEIQQEARASRQAREGNVREAFRNHGQLAGDLSQIRDDLESFRRTQQSGVDKLVGKLTHKLDATDGAVTELAKLFSPMAGMVSVLWEAHQRLTANGADAVIASGDNIVDLEDARILRRIDRKIKGDDDAS